jgi:hypothetical protein
MLELPPPRHILSVLSRYPKGQTGSQILESPRNPKSLLGVINGFSVFDVHVTNDLINRPRGLISSTTSKPVSSIINSGRSQ